MLSSRFTGPLIVLALCTVWPASGRQSSSPTPVQSASVAAAPLVRDPQAISVLTAAVAALGRTPPSDSSASGTVTVSSGTKTEDGTINILTLGLKQTVEEISLPGSTEKTIVSGWVAAQDDGTGQKLISAQSAVVSQSVYFPLPLLAGALANADFSFQYLGLETVEGGTAHHIRMWTTFASKSYLQKFSKYSGRDIWIDSASNLPRKMSYIQQSAIGAPQILVDIELSNYRNFNGVMYPTIIQKSLNGTPRMAISIDSVNFNIGLTGSAFAINCTN